MANVYCAEVIIANLERRGKGVYSDPVRIITQVYTKEGELIAENDPQPTTFALLDLVHFANYCKGKNIKLVRPEHVDEWLKSIENKS